MKKLLYLLFFMAPLANAYTQKCLVTASRGIVGPASICQWPESWHLKYLESESEIQAQTCFITFTQEEVRFITEQLQNFIERHPDNKFKPARKAFNSIPEQIAQDQAIVASAREGLDKANALDLRAQELLSAIKRPQSNPQRARVKCK